VVHQGDDLGVMEQVARELGLYVYLLVDPRSGVPFYVGKGRGLRHAAHGLEAEEVAGVPSQEQSRKHSLINDIRGDGLEPETWILRYGLTSGEYTAVEAAAIDLLLSFALAPIAPDSVRVPLGERGLLTNARREDARGHGIRLLSSLVDEYAAPELEVKFPLLLITFNGWTDLPEGEVIAGGRVRTGAGYRPEWLASPARVRAYPAIGDSVSAWWVLSEASLTRRGIQHVVAVHRGVTRALFEIVPGSWETVDTGRDDSRGRPVRRSGFQVRPVEAGELFAQVVGPHGHRVPRRARGAQNAIYYWPRA
jgi:hypothetical protein